MTLAKKAGAAFALLALLTIGGQSLVIGGAGSSAQKVETFRTRTAVFQKTVLAMIIDWYVYDDQNNMYMLVAATSPRDQSLVSATWDQGEAGAKQFEIDLATAKRTAPAAAEADLAKVTKDFSGYNGFALQTRADELAGRILPASILITVTNANVSNDLMADLTAAQSDANSLADSSLASVRANQNTLKTTALLAGTLTLVLIAMLGFLFWRSVLRPLKTVAERMNDIAHGEGDLKARIEDGRRDEIGDLGRSFNYFIGRIQSVMAGFVESIVALLSASNALEAITVDTGTNADRTAATASSVSLAAEQVARNITAVATGAEQMRASIGAIAMNADHAAQVAASGRSRAEETTLRVQRLAVSSGEIDGVVRLISAVASQTNLLALNATIEAARAGTAGMGFAVVAGEVKSLAAETASATRDITQRVAAIQAETAQTVQAIAEICTVIEEIGEIQSTIAAAVEEQHASTGEITRSAAEAADGAGQITASVSSIARAVGDTSVGVAASSETIAELGQLSDSLSKLIGQFKI